MKPHIVAPPELVLVEVLELDVVAPDVLVLELALDVPEPDELDAGDPVLDALEAVDAPLWAEVLFPVLGDPPAPPPPPCDDPPPGPEADELFPVDEVAPPVPMVPLVEHIVVLNAPTAPATKTQLT